MTVDLRRLLIIVAVWTVGSLVLATLWHWLRPHVPARRLVVVARTVSGRRIVAVAGTARTVATDRIVAEIDPVGHVISLPRRRVPTADPGCSVTVSGTLRYEILDGDKADNDSEPIAVALGDGIVAAVDEALRDMPLGRAVRSHHEIGRGLAEVLGALRVHGIAITIVELMPFLGPEGQTWGSAPVRIL